MVNPQSELPITCEVEYEVRGLPNFQNKQKEDKGTFQDVLTGSAPEMSRNMKY